MNGDLAKSLCPARNNGFTLVEAMLALAITAIAGSALLLGLNSSVQLTEHNEKRVIAQGMARQLMDEILGARYLAIGASPHQYPLCPSSWEAELDSRERYDDIDDFHDWESLPPEDGYGIPLGENDGKGGERKSQFFAPGEMFKTWRQEVRVTYADPNDLTQSLLGSSTSDYRAVQVKIVEIDPDRGPIELAKIRRIVAYVPALDAAAVAAGAD
jgi:prepilin-type N-terminal cleavage/methylation domain-containing protein